jgi:hypothetical protein
MTQNQGNDQNVIIDAILNSVASTEYWTAIITVFSCWLAKAGWDKYQEAKKPNSHDKELWDYIDDLLPIGTINLWRDSDANRRFNHSEFSPIMNFVDYFSINEPSKNFLDSKLEKLKQELFEHANEFAGIIVKYTVPNQHNLQWLPRSHEGNAPDNIDEIVDNANHSLDRMVLAYDKFNSEAIRKIKNKKID